MTTPTTSQILEALWDFAHERPGIEAADYLMPYAGGGEAWSESRRALWRDRAGATRDLNRFKRLYHRASDHVDAAALTADDVVEYTKGRRLSLEVGEDGRHGWSYTAGQNYPTEYRWHCAELLDDILRQDFSYRSRR